eukprot:m.79060 g.79060  ORF g.79060 m.79060 type:complete len:446 (+) comp10773_c0_seq2:578-1915(+)
MAFVVLQVGGWLWTLLRELRVVKSLVAIHRLGQAAQWAGATVFILGPLAKRSRDQPTVGLAFAKHPNAPRHKRLGECGWDLVLASNPSRQRFLVRRGPRLGFAEKVDRVDRIQILFAVVHRRKLDHNVVHQQRFSGSVLALAFSEQVLGMPKDLLLHLPLVLLPAVACPPCRRLYPRSHWARPNASIQLAPLEREQDLSGRLEFGVVAVPDKVDDRVVQSCVRFWVVDCLGHRHGSPSLAAKLEVLRRDDQRVHHHILERADHSMLVDLVVEVEPCAKRVVHILDVLFWVAHPKLVVVALCDLGRVHEVGINRSHRDSGEETVALVIVQLVHVEPRLGVVDQKVEPPWAGPGVTLVPPLHVLGLDSLDKLLDESDVLLGLQPVRLEVNPVGPNQVFEHHGRAFLVGPAVTRGDHRHDVTVKDVRERPVTQVVAQARQLHAQCIAV